MSPGAKNEKSKQLNTVISIRDSAPIYSKIIGDVYAGVNSVTSRWGEYSNPCCFSGKLGLEKGPFGAYHKLNTNNLLNSFQKMKKSWKS